MDGELPMAIEEIESLDSECAAKIVASNPGGVRFSQLQSLSSRTASILSQTSSDLEFPSLATITADAANALVSHSGSLDLSGISHLSADVATALAHHNGPLSFPSLLQLSPEAARGLSLRRHATSLSGLMELPEPVAEALATCSGPLDLSGIAAISDVAARFLARHSGTLNLNGLTTLSDAASEFLGKHDGPLSLNSVRSISIATAEGLSQSSSFLSLDGIDQPNAATLYLISHTSGELSLRSLDQIDHPHLNALIANRRVLLSARANDVVACGEAASKGNADAQYELGLLYSDDEILGSESGQAAVCYQNAANQGHSDAQFRLGDCMMTGKGVTMDQKSACEWYRKAAVQGNPDAQFSLGECYADGIGMAHDDEQSYYWLREGSLSGHPKAQYLLGVCYENGVGVDPDYAMAAKWYREAAEQENPAAQHNFAVCLSAGRGVAQKDPEESLKWFRMAAGQGFAESQWVLGNYAFEEENFYEAAKWYQKAAEQGHAHSQFRLGSCCMNGNGLPPDQTEGVKWYRKSAEQGNQDAQCALGRCYARGDGVEKDYQEAAKWLSSGGQLYWAEAVNGDSDAQISLGDGFKFGWWHLPQDKVQSAKWYQKAAILRNAEAEFKLATCFDLGQGVGKDLVLAFGWFQLAAKQGHPRAQFEVGHRLLNGIGTHEDEPNGFHWLQKAAEQGEVLGQLFLGHCHMTGRGIQRDFTLAAQWYRTAAEMGLAEAQHAYSVALANGMGIPQDSVEELIWLQKAAEQGLVAAQAAMAYRYELRPSPWSVGSKAWSVGSKECWGRHPITQQDPEETVKWLTMSAERGDAESMFRLGWHYLCGCGVEADEKIGESWFRKAADLNHAVARTQVDGTSTERPYGPQRIKSDKELYSYTKLLKRTRDRDIDAIMMIMRHYFSIATKVEHSRSFELRDSVLIVASDAIEKSQTDEAGGQWEKVDMPKQAAKQNGNQYVSAQKSIYVYSPPKGKKLMMELGQGVLIQGNPGEILQFICKVDVCYFFRSVEKPCEDPTETNVWGWHAWRWCLLAAEYGSSEASKLMGAYYSRHRDKERSQYWFNRAKKIRSGKCQSVGNQFGRIPLTSNQEDNLALRDPVAASAEVGVRANKDKIGQQEETGDLTPEELRLDAPAINDSPIITDQLPHTAQPAAAHEKKGKPLPWIICACVIILTLGLAKTVSCQNRERLKLEATAAQAREDDARANAALQLKSKAATGDALSQAILARGYLLGCDGMQVDLYEAREWAEKSTSQNHPLGLHMLGVWIQADFGRPKQQRESEAQELFTRAIQAGFLKDVQNEGGPWIERVGLAYLRGDRGIAKDEKQAVMWFRRAVELNDIVAMGDLGYCYESGLGVDKNETVAAQWYREAADKGDRFSVECLTK